MRTAPRQAKHSCSPSPQAERHTDLRSESGSRHGNGERPGDIGTVPPNSGALPDPGMQERALTPFPLFLLVGLDLEDATARALGHLVCLHGYLLRHLRAGKKESGATTRFGEV